MAELTLPGALPGLLRRGSPVVLPHSPDDGRGVVVWVGPSEIGDLDVKAAWDPGTGHIYTLRYFAANHALDLTDATGRAHAAWWLLCWLISQAV